MLRSIDENQIVALSEEKLIQNLKNVCFSEDPDISGWVIPQFEPWCFIPRKTYAAENNNHASIKFC